MAFNPTITFGNLVEIATIIVGGLIFLWEMRNKIALIQFNQENFIKHIERIDRDIETLSKATVTLAEQSVRISNVEEKLSELFDKVRDTHTRAVAKRRRKRQSAA